MDNIFPISIPDGMIINSINPLGNDNWHVYCSQPDDIFKGEYPRIALFLLAIGRKLISEMTFPYKNCLRRVHTDGFVLTESNSQDRLIKTTDNAHKTLGSLKFEKEGMCHIKNANQVIWT